MSKFDGVFWWATFDINHAVDNDRLSELILLISRIDQALARGEQVYRATYSAVLHSGRQTGILTT